MSVADILRHTSGPVSLRARWVLPIDLPPIEHGEVVVEDGRIVSVGKAVRGEATFDFGLSAICPGFIGAGFRLEETLLRGLLDSTEPPNQARLHSTLLAHLTLEERTVSATLGAAELLACGVTALGDISPSGASLTALLASGQRGVVYREVSQGVRAEAALPILGSRLAQMQAQIARSGADERTQAGIAAPVENDATFQSFATQKDVPFLPIGDVLSAADPFTEMRFLAQATARAALKRVTADSAQTLSLEKDVGSLARGKRADLCVVRLDGLHTFPVAEDDPETALAHFARASDVALTIVDGRVLYESGRWTLLDVPRLRLSASETRTKLRSERDKAVASR